MNAGLIVFLLLVVLSFLGVPIFLAIAIATMVALTSAGFPMETIVQKTFLGLNSSSLLAIPLFIFAGNAMSYGITQRLLNVADAFLGRVRGSLGAVTIVASGLFGAISGSGVATVSAIGGMTIPAMIDSGYDKNYAAACASSASLLGPLVPPSITLIVYASLTEVSVQKLFLATALPAIVLLVAFLAYALYYGKKHDLPTQPKKSGKEIASTLKESLLALLMPVIVLGSIFSGICTVTEAAAISAVYAVLVNMVAYREMNWKVLKDVLYESAISVASIMIMVGMSKASAYVVIASQLPQLFMNFVTSITSNVVVVLIIINIILLILGCMMDGTAIVVMMVPLMLSLVTAMNINLIHFGIVVALNIYIGMITPPVGITLLVGTKIAKTGVGSVFRSCLPFMMISLILLLIVTYVPSFSLLLPNLLG